MSGPPPAAAVVQKQHSGEGVGVVLGRVDPPRRGSGVAPDVGYLAEVGGTEDTRGGDREEPGVDVAARTAMTKQALNYLLGQMETGGYLQRRDSARAPRPSSWTSGA